MKNKKIALFMSIIFLLTLQIFGEKEKKQLPSIKNGRVIASIKNPSVNNITQEQNENFYRKEIWKNEIEKKILLKNTDLLKVSIKEIDIITFKNKKYKKVIASFSHKNGGESKFNALVDPISGKFVKTWNQTQDENRKETLIKLDLSQRFISE